MTYSALRVSVFVAAASAIIYGFSPQVFVYGKVSFLGTLFAMAGPPVTVYVMPLFMHGHHGTAFWTSTATQILDDYEGYFIPHPYAPVHLMIPVRHFWPIPFPLADLPVYQQGLAESEDLVMDEEGVFRLFRFVLDDFQRVYIFADLAGGIEVYIQRAAGTIETLHHFRSAGTWDPIYWWAAVDLRAIGAVGAGRLPSWAERALDDRRRV